MDLGDIGADHTLKAAAQDLISEDGWTTLDAPLLSDGSGETSAAFKRVEDFFMLRLRTTVKSVLDDPSNLTRFPRPELLSDESLLEKLGVEVCWQATVEEILAPGDVVAMVNFTDQVYDDANNKAGQQMALLMGSQPPSACAKSWRERIAQWRDFPCEGLLTLVEIPFDHESRTFVSQSGGHFATVSVVQPHSNRNEMVVTVGLFVTGFAFPSWASAHLAQMASSIQQFIHLTCSSFKSIDRLIEADDALYVVLSLRTCPQGRPLLPAALPEQPSDPGDDPWFVILDSDDKQAPSFWFRPVGGFNFPNYLFLFLAAIGCPQVQVHNVMDGRLLVPYQAVVRRTQWMSVAQYFDAAWKVHKVAYRKLNSSKHAPTISEARTPRFAQVSDECSNQPSIPLKSLISVHNTFIEVDDLPAEAPMISRTKSF